MDNWSFVLTSASFLLVLLTQNNLINGKTSYDVKLQLKFVGRNLVVTKADRSGVTSNGSWIFISWPSNVKPIVWFGTASTFEYPIPPTCDLITASVFVLTENGVSDVSGNTVIRGLPEAPRKPVDLQVVFNYSIFGHSISWKMPRTETRNCLLIYELNQRQENEKVWHSKCNTTNEEYHIPLLRPNTNYEYRVRALVGEDRIPGPYSTPVSNRTGHLLRTALEISNVESTLNSLKIHWRLLSPVQANYGYHLTLVDASREIHFDIPAVQTWYKLTNLSSCTEYTILLTSHYMSMISLPLVTRAKTYPRDLPQSPEVIRTNSKCGSIFVSWNPPEDYEYVSSFSVIAYAAKTKKKVVSATTNLEMWLHDLECDERYYLTVHASNACGLSKTPSITEVIAMERVPASRPEFITFQPTHDSITIGWNGSQPTKVGLIYRVDFWEINSTIGAAPLDTMTTPYTNITIGRLPSCTMFYLEVTASNLFGKSDTDKAIVETLPPKPSAPDKLQVQQIDPTTHNISWDAVSLCYSLCSIAYQVNIYNETDNTELNETTVQTFFAHPNLGPEQTYHYKVRSLAGGIPVESDYTETVILSTPPDDEDGLRSVWSYVIIVGLLCILTVFVLVALIYGRKVRTGIHYEHQINESEADEPFSRSSLHKKQTTLPPDFVGAESINLPNGITHMQNCVK